MDSFQASHLYFEFESCLYVVFSDSGCHFMKVISTTFASVLNHGSHTFVERSPYPKPSANTWTVRTPSRWRSRFVQPSSFSISTYRCHRALYRSHSSSSSENIGALLLSSVREECRLPAGMVRVHTFSFEFPWY